MNWQLFSAYLLITLILFLIPGPIVTLVIATSVSKGLRAGLVTVAGTSCGTAVLLAVIALGLSWILNHALYWFEMLRWAGAVYLIWLGIQAWRGAGAAAPLRPDDRVQFGRGFLVALSNPKTIAFFTAFLPQFVDPGLPAAPQLAAMCAVSVLLALERFGLGHSGEPRARLVHEARARQAAGPPFRPRADRRRIWLSLSRRPA